MYWETKYIGFFTLMNTIQYCTFDNIGEVLGLVITHLPVLSIKMVNYIYCLLVGT